MATLRERLESMLDQLEGDLPRLIVEFPDADGADFWMAFARRTTVIEAIADAADLQLVRDRLDRMLDSRGLIPMEEQARALP